MTREELDELGTDLKELEAELAAALELSEEGAKPVDLDQPIGRLSRIDAIQQQKMVSASRRNQRARLSRVVAALARIASDEFGECIECEEPIGYRRLKARPETTLCIACQGARESRG